MERRRGREGEVHVGKWRELEKGVGDDGGERKEREREGHMYIYQPLCYEDTKLTNTIARSHCN